MSVLGTFPRREIRVRSIAKDFCLAATGEDVRAVLLQGSQKVEFSVRVAIRSTSPEDEDNFYTIDGIRHCLFHHPLLPGSIRMEDSDIHQCRREILRCCRIVHKTLCGDRGQNHMLSMCVCVCSQHNDMMYV